MTDKYAGLPGIDIESADVLETSDIDSEVEIEVRTDIDASEKNSDIEEPELNSDEARSRFANAVLVGDINMVDFLGNISNRSLTKIGYKVNEVDETVDQRLSRIARELEEIKLLQLNDISNKNSSECEKLTSVLESLDNDRLLSSNNLNQYNSRIKQVFDLITSRLETHNSDNAKTPEESQLVDTSLVLALESRINAIESILGSETAIGTQSKTDGTPTIQNWLKDLNRKLNVVHNPEYQLGTVKHEVALLTKQLETLASQKKFLDLSHPVPGNSPHQPDSDNSQIHSKIEDLHGNLANFNHFNATVPLIIARLKTLHTVHADLANTVQTVNELDLILSDIKIDMKKWNNSIDVVNSNIHDHEQQFETNKQYIDSVLKDLNEKFNNIVKDVD